MDQYDLAVIGGGSGGLAAAKEAARLGAKVVCFDYVQPSPHGSKWGVGGTCVNVGCIPKILMHNSARIGHCLHNSAEAFGWTLAPTGLDFTWEKLVQTIQLYIKQLNFSYKMGLKAAGVEYINAAARFVDSHTLAFSFRGQDKTLSAKYILVAVGGRPYVPRNVPGVYEHAITSDDLFSLKQAPGKTLIVGASYIALECAGVLNDLGYDVTVAVRSIVLRGFDRQCAEKIQSIMAEGGVKFKHDTVTSIEKLDLSPQTSTSDSLPDTYPATHHSISQASTGVGLLTASTPTGGRSLQVTFASNEQEVFETVLYAVGRRANTQGLNCDAAHVDLDNASGKILTDEEDRTSSNNIFAVGDVAFGRPELTPVAVRAAELLARRLFGASNELMNYRNIPTVVFTPVEYGCCGLSEEEAIAKYGADSIEVFLSGFNPVAVSACHWKKAPALCKDEFDTDITPINLSKLICLRDSLQVVGYHCIAMNAGEQTQGYALALAHGLTKHDFDRVVGIHPTDAESFHSLSITRRSGAAEDCVYFEHQGQNTRQCGLHCLNNLLQGPVFTAAELQQLGLHFDSAEQQMLGMHADFAHASADGYYSVEVMVAALQQRGYSMKHVHGQEFKELRTSPAKYNDGFVLNLRDHWLAVRPVKGRWFSLDSLSAPEPISESRINSFVTTLQNQSWTLLVVRHKDWPRTKLPEPQPASFPQILKITDGTLREAAFYSFAAASRLNEDRGGGGIGGGGGGGYAINTGGGGGGTETATKPYEWPSGGQTTGGLAPGAAAAASQPQEDDPELAAIIRESVTEYKKSLPALPDEPVSGSKCVSLRVQDLTPQGSSISITRRFPPCARMADVFRWLFKDERIWPNTSLGMSDRVVLTGQFPNRLFICEKQQIVRFHEGPLTHPLPTNLTDISHLPLSTLFPEGADSLRLAYVE